MPSTEAILLILLAMSAYATASVSEWVTGRRKGEARTPLSVATMAAGIALSLATVMLRLARGHAPGSSGLDTFALLAALTGAVAAYLWTVRVLGRAGLLLLPLATLWAGVAAGLSGQAYRDFARDTWTVIHVAMAALSILAFAVSAVAGWLYLRKYAQLRRKDPRLFDGPATSLERIERFLRRCLPLAFALVTATIVTGLVEAVGHRTYFRNWVTHPKMLGAGVTWLIYTVALHAAYARRFRARVVAKLAFVGFLLLVVVMIGAMLLPQ